MKQRITSIGFLLKGHSSYWRLWFSSNFPGPCFCLCSCHNKMKLSNHTTIPFTTFNAIQTCRYKSISLDCLYGTNVAICIPGQNSKGVELFFVEGNVYIHSMPTELFCFRREWGVIRVEVFQVVRSPFRCVYVWFSDTYHERTLDCLTKWCIGNKIHFKVYEID